MHFLCGSQNFHSIFEKTILHLVTTNDEFSFLDLKTEIKTLIHWLLRKRKMAKIQRFSSVVESVEPEISIQQQQQWNHVIQECCRRRVRKCIALRAYMCLITMMCTSTHVLFLTTESCICVFFIATTLLTLFLAFCFRHSCVYVFILIRSSTLQLRIVHVSYWLMFWKSVVF